MKSSIHREPRSLRSQKPRADFSILYRVLMEHIFYLQTITHKKTGCTIHVFHCCRLLDKLKRNAPQRDEGVGEQFKKVKRNNPPPLWYFHKNFRKFCSAILNIVVVNLFLNPGWFFVYKFFKWFITMGWGF